MPVNAAYTIYLFLNHHCTFSFITAHFVHHCTLKQALPIFTWRLNGALLVSSIPPIKIKIIYQSVYYAESTVSSNDGALDNYECQLTFSAPLRSSTYIVTNVPEFSESCSTKG